MAKLSENITYKSGFYNNKVVNGVNDRPYTAEEMRNPYRAVYTDGVRPTSDGTAGNELKVVASNGRYIAVSTGFAILGGAWFINESAYLIELDPAIDTTRYDCVIIQNDDNDNARSSKIYVKSLGHKPTIDDLEPRDGNIYEICVGYVTVPPTTDIITDDLITDTREDGVLCNLMSGVGATVVRTFRNTYYSESENQADIPIGIPQYNRTRDTLIVAVEGRILTEGINYTVVDNSKITLTIGLPVVGTKIDFEVLKNVNAAGAETVVQEVAQLRNEVTANNKKLEYDYYCNGVNDNEVISYLVTDFLRSGTDSNSRKFNIIGHFGYYRMMSGEGSSSNPYNLFDFIIENTMEFTRNVTLDFTSCDEIRFTPNDNATNVIFNSQKIRVVGANVRASNSSIGTIVRVFNSSRYPIACENCRFWITGYQDSIIARNGTFINCRGSITNSINNSYCFNVTPYGAVELIGGEYYSYVGSSTSNVAAVIGQSGSTSVSILHGVSVPAKARGSYKQTHAIYQMTGGGYVSCYGLITTLPTQLMDGQSHIAGTIPLDKENLI